jgi:MFS family permease
MLILLRAPRVFSKIGGYKFLLSTALISLLSLLGISFLKNPWLVLLMFLLYLSFNVLVFFSIDEFLKILSIEKSTGVTRGRYMALANLAWILAQLSSGIFIGKLEIHKIYLAGFILMGVGWVFAFLNLKKIKEPKYDNLNIHKSLLKFFKNKNLIRAYAFSFLLQIFYSFMLIYTPLYLSAHLGFSWQNIGIIFTIMLIPFSIVPILFGKHVDKVGEKSALMFGFLIITISTWILFFIPKEASILIWAIALFMTRVGAALIETMSDVYFFKHIKEEKLGTVFKGETKVGIKVEDLLKLEAVL